MVQAHKPGGPTLLLLCAGGFHQPDACTPCLHLPKIRQPGTGCALHASTMLGAAAALKLSDCRACLLHPSMQVGELLYIDICNV